MFPPCPVFDERVQPSIMPMCKTDIMSISRFAFPKHEIETMAEVALLHVDIALPVGGDNIFS